MRATGNVTLPLIIGGPRGRSTGFPTSDMYSFGWRGNFEVHVDFKNVIYYLF